MEDTTKITIVAILATVAVLAVTLLIAHNLDNNASDLESEKYQMSFQDEESKLVYETGRELFDKELTATETLDMMEEQLWP